jgi:hypothetical protein
MSGDREGKLSEGDVSESKVAAPAGASSNERREALIKLGKYAAYATPIVIASVSAVYGAPVSGAPVSPPPIIAPPPS